MMYGLWLLSLSLSFGSTGTCSKKQQQLVACSPAFSPKKSRETCFSCELELKLKLKLKLDYSIEAGTQKAEAGACN